MKTAMLLFALAGVGAAVAIVVATRKPVYNYTLTQQTEPLVAGIAQTRWYAEVLAADHDSGESLGPFDTEDEARTAAHAWISERGGSAREV